MKELAEQVNKSSKQLLKASTKVLEKLESSKGSLDNSSQDSTLPLLDPGKRSTNLIENQKRYLIRVEPYQPVLPEYPVMTRVAGENLKQSRFNPTWFKEYPHLEYSISKDAAFCFVCSLFAGGPGAAKANNAWVKEGVQTWHKFRSVGSKTEGKLSKHFSSQAHKSTHLSYAHFAKTCGHIDDLLDKAKHVALIQEEDDRQQNKRVIEILLEITRTLGRQGIAFCGHGNDDDKNFKQIVKLMAKYCPGLRHWINTTQLRPYHVTYLSAQSQNELIKLVGHEVQQRIKMLKMLVCTPLWQIQHQTCCTTIGWPLPAHMGQPTERLVSFGEAKDKTGEGGATEIIGSKRNKV